MSLLLKLLIIAALGTGLYFFASSSFFNVKSLAVEGNSYYSEDEILTMADCKAGGNIFWGTGIGEAKKRLREDPYIKQVKIKRLLPDRVLIEIEERKEAGAVIYGDEFIIIDGEGTVLRKTGTEPRLPLIQGLTVSRLDEGAALEAEQHVRLRQILELIETMEASDMYFKRIAVSEAGIKAYVLDSLICSGTPKSIIEAMEKGNLQKSIKALFDRNIQRGTIKVSGDDYISFSPAFD